MILRCGMRLVDIGDDIITKIEEFSLPSEISKEAGGILIGSYRGPHVEVLHCTTPLPGDRRLWNLFDRRDQGHRYEALRRWEESGRTTTFVGEWHTHSEPKPTPSFIDRTNWSKIAKRHRIGPLILAIRGISGWWFGIMRDGVLFPLVPL
jgi:integrative and conjugative element protein (TIGR02256 family)